MRQSGWVTVSDFPHPSPWAGTFWLAYMAGPESLLLFYTHWESVVVNSVILSIAHAASELDPGRHHSPLSCGNEWTECIRHPGEQGFVLLTYSCSVKIKARKPLGWIELWRYTSPIITQFSCMKGHHTDLKKGCIFGNCFATDQISVSVHLIPLSCCGSVVWSGFFLHWLGLINQSAMVHATTHI